MMDREFRSLFKNDTVIGRRLDGDDSDEDVQAYNTGPKGVRSDARAFAASQSERQAEEARVRQRADAQLLRNQAAPWSESDARDRWVEARLKELSKSSPLVESVDAMRYLERIESMQHVAVVIHVADSTESQEFLNTLPFLARKYAGLKFITLPHLEADMDEVACPAFLVYDHGNLIVNLMRVVDELQSGEEVSRRTIEDVLVKKGALKAQYKLD